ncbi:uncharacterized protein DS421_12g372180 [Arachis hypogaea]|nr:uncharacterized protein LOC112729337 [Arachis hypogaea]QHO24429.1 uncharacterized protein DS421_12g372180 [Arachis hypogaea]
MPLQLQNVKVLKMMECSGSRNQGQFLLQHMQRVKISLSLLLLRMKAGLMELLVKTDKLIRDTKNQPMNHHKQKILLLKIMMVIHMGLVQRSIGVQMAVVKKILLTMDDQ